MNTAELTEVQQCRLTLTVRSSVPRATCAWMEGYSKASPYNSMVARMAFCNKESTLESFKNLLCKTVLFDVTK